MKEYETKLQDPAIIERIEQKREQALEMLDVGALQEYGTDIFGKPLVQEVNRVGKPLDASTLAFLAARAMSNLEHLMVPLEVKRSKYAEGPASIHHVPISQEQVKTMKLAIESAVKSMDFE